MDLKCHILYAGKKERMKKEEPLIRGYLAQTKDNQCSLFLKSYLYDFLKNDRHCPFIQEQWEDPCYIYSMKWCSRMLPLSPPTTQITMAISVGTVEARPNPFLW